MRDVQHERTVSILSGEDQPSKALRALSSPTTQTLYVKNYIRERDIFEFIFQLLGELILQLMFELGFRSMAEPIALRENRNKSLTILGYGLWGFFAGVLSLAVAPNYLIKDPNYQIINLIITPIIIGICMAALGGLLRRRNKTVLAFDSFVNGYAFALVMSLSRWFWAN